MRGRFTLGRKQIVILSSILVKYNRSEKKGEIQRN
jgi:hypothetical protein